MMNSEIHKRYKEQNGMATLEAAIILPLVLTLLFFLISSVRLLREDSLLRYAIDQACEEMALLIPAAEIIASPLRSEAVDVAAMVEEILPLPEANELIIEMATDLGSSLMLSTLINSRIDFWLNEARVALGLDHISHNRQIFLNWNGSNKVINLVVKYNQNTLLGPIKKSARGIIPLWTQEFDQNSTEEIGDEQGEEDDGIWSLSNFVRGQKFRQLYGANLPFNFPVIAIWDGSTATSIKSMDLTAPSYYSAEQATMQLERHLIQLANFHGCCHKSGGKEYIVPEKIVKKRLLLIIPHNHPQWLDQYQMGVWQELAASYSVNLEIRKYKISLRYQLSD